MLDKLKKLETFDLVAIICIILVCFAFTPITFQNDTYYTIKVGERIVNEGIQPIDNFNIHKDLPYTYPHWLYDVGTYVLYSVGGLNILYLFTIFLASALGLLLYYTNYKLCKNRAISFFVVIITIYFMSAFITARAQLITYIFFVLEIYFIEQFFRKNQNRYLIGLIICSIMIANLHVAVWPFFFILFLPYFVANIFQKPKHIFRGSKVVFEKYNNIIMLLITFVICFACGLLTPLKLTPYTYLVLTMMGTTTKSINEHLPLIINSVTGVNMFACIAMYSLLLIFTGTKIKFKDILMLAGLILLTFFSQRQFSMLALIGSFIFARLLEKFCRFGPQKENMKNFEKNIGSKYKILAIIIITGIIVVPNVYKRRNHTYVDTIDYPIQAADYINQYMDKSKMRLYNEYNYGSYLIFKDIEVFIDSRADLYDKKFNKKEDIFSDYISTSNLSMYYEDTFEKYNITHVMTTKSSKLKMMLTKDSDYKLVYNGDDNFVIYERTNRTIWYDIEE